VNNSRSDSGGSAKLSQTPGSRATFTFTGTEVRWIAHRDPWSGIAGVYIDGVFKCFVDTYASTSSTRARAVVHTTSGLPSGTHTIVIEATGIKRPAAKGAWVWVDAFDYVGTN